MNEILIIFVLRTSAVYCGCADFDNFDCKVGKAVYFFNDFQFVWTLNFERNL